MKKGNQTSYFPFFLATKYSESPLPLTTALMTPTATVWRIWCVTESHDWYLPARPRIHPTSSEAVPDPKSVAGCRTAVSNASDLFTRWPRMPESVKSARRKKRASGQKPDIPKSMENQYRATKRSWISTPTTWKHLRGLWKIKRFTLYPFSEYLYTFRTISIRACLVRNCEKRWCIRSGTWTISSRYGTTLGYRLFHAENPVPTCILTSHTQSPLPIFPIISIRPQNTPYDTYNRDNLYNQHFLQILRR